MQLQGFDWLIGHGNMLNNALLLDNSPDFMLSHIIST